MDGCPVLFHNIFTNGINYLRFGFDIMDLKEYAPYISLLTELIGFVDTDKHDKLELSNEILLHAGGLGLSVTTYKKKKSGGYSIILEVTTKVLYPETGYVLGLLQEILTTSHIWDEKRLREVIGEVRSDLQISLQSSGNVTATGRAMSYLAEHMYYREQFKGVAYYDFLCDLEAHFEEKKENLIKVLKTLAETIFVKERMSIGITADEKGYAELDKSLGNLASGLPDEASLQKIEPDWKISKPADNEGFKTAGKVQYVARAGKFSDRGVNYSGIFKVVKTILSYDYLWNEVRVKGGAYGVMCLFAEEGIGYLVSYRDPNLSETNDVFCSVPVFERF